jgi:hypothetical protein
LPRRLEALEQRRQRVRDIGERDARERVLQRSALGGDLRSGGGCVGGGERRRLGQLARAGVGGEERGERSERVLRRVRAIGLRRLGALRLLDGGAHELADERRFLRVRRGVARGGAGCSWSGGEGAEERTRAGERVAGGRDVRDVRVGRRGRSSAVERERRRFRLLQGLRRRRDPERRERERDLVVALLFLRAGGRAGRLRPPRLPIVARRRGASGRASVAVARVACAVMARNKCGLPSEFVRKTDSPGRELRGGDFRVVTRRPALGGERDALQRQVGALDRLARTGEVGAGKSKPVPTRRVSSTAPARDPCNPRGHHDLRA